MPKIHVWYKLSGEIVAVGHAMGKASCLPVSGDAESVLETEVEESYISSLCQSHMIDPLRQVLTKIEPITAHRD
jgi:hypothetical protein